MERKILRKIYGPVKDNSSFEWRRRKNRARNIILKHNHNEIVIKSKTPMGRPRLEKPK